MSYEKQVCFNCRTEFNNKPYIEVCPVCRSKHIVHEPREFTNFGDINYLEFGGNLVYRSFNSPSGLEGDTTLWDIYNKCFEVFRLYTPFDLGDGQYRIYRITVDVDDYEDYKEEILYASGNEGMKDVPWLQLFEEDLARLASEIVDTGYGDVCEVIDISNEEEVIERLCDLGLLP